MNPFSSLPETYKKKKLLVRLTRSSSSDVLAIHLVFASLYFVIRRTVVLKVEKLTGQENKILHTIFTEYSNDKYMYYNYFLPCTFFKNITFHTMQGLFP